MLPSDLGIVDGSRDVGRAMVCVDGDSGVWERSENM